MKNYKYVLLLPFLILLANCASAPSAGSDAYRGQAAEVILAKGEKSLRKKHFKEAIAHYEAFDALYPFDPRAEQALLDLMFAYYKANDYDSTLATSDRYLRLYPMSTKADYVLYIRGVASMEHNHSWIYNAFPCDPAKRDLVSLQQAFNDFQKLIKVYPGSAYIPDAHKRMVHIKTLLAKHELQTAQFYFQRHAYVAAANRASYIVQHLHGAPQVPEALRIMIKSYRALGDKHQADEALEVLKFNYPNAKV
jgi:outer membrane protein assembly factor BamD